MPLQSLTEEQIRTWTREQKDKWWLENIYRGDMPQLTLRAALTGFVLGGILAAMALYIGGKTGIGIGVGLTSVIVSFAVFRLLHQAGLGADFTILENNCVQSICTAAGYMTMPLISCLPSYMLVTGRLVGWWHLFAWMVVVSILGVFLAFPLKRRFINEEQLPFPEGRASGVVLDALYHGKAEHGMFKARLLAWTGVGAGLINFISGDGWMRLVQFTLLRMHQWTGMKEPWVLAERLDTYYYNLAAKYHLWIPSILGTDVRQLGLRLTLDLSMVGVGGLMGIRVATSCLLGAFINFAVLAPIMIRHGDIVQRVATSGKVIPISRAEIVNQWALWWGVAMMVVGSLVSLAGKPELFRGLFGKKKAGTSSTAGADVLKHIELPLWLSGIAIPIFTVLGAAVSHYYFGVPWLLAFISFPLIFVLTIICTNSMALTSWTPTGSLAKITQFTMGAIDRTNPASNLIPAGMTSEISANAANLLSDIKPGYMLGAKPRQQAIGHVIGIFSGALAAVPLFYLLFLPAKNGVRSVDTIVSDQFAMPAALQWKGVAELIAHGLKALPPSAIISVVVACLCAAAFEIARIVTKGRFPLSAVSIGLGVVLPPEYVFTMWLGAAFFWWFGRKDPAPGTKAHDYFVEGSEPICAGLISGWALVGIGNSILNVLLY
ncbi:MAG: OPT/YSL family transporter [Verrucomicrobia bacterium]|nr:OPT/YSL family transporter [Verrucomicrobiota bacterium]